MPKKTLLEDLNVNECLTKAFIQRTCNAVSACLSWVVPVGIKPVKLSLFLPCTTSFSAYLFAYHIFLITIVFPFLLCFFPPGGCRVGGVFEGGSGGGEKARALRRELGDLERAERALDDLIHSSSAQLKQLTEQKDNQRYPSHQTLLPSVCVSRSMHVYLPFLFIRTLILPSGLLCVP